MFCRDTIAMVVLFRFYYNCWWQFFFDILRLYLEYDAIKWILSAYWYVFLLQHDVFAGLACRIAVKITCHFRWWNQYMESLVYSQVPAGVLCLFSKGLMSSYFNSLGIMCVAVTWKNRTCHNSCAVVTYARVMTRIDYHMMTSSNGNIFRVTGPLCGEFTGPGEFPTQRPVTRSIDVFFDLRLNKRLSKQPWGWWFETLSRPLWRHRNEYQYYSKQNLTRSQLWTQKLMVTWFPVFGDSHCKLQLTDRLN